VNSVQQDREFVAAQSGHDVGFANAAFQTPRHGDQQLITDRMTQTVVDVLKTIEVKKEYSKLIVLLVFSALDDEFQVFSQQRAIRQVRQRVVEGRVTEVIFAFLQLLADAFLFGNVRFNSST
jgi:hypothetical protein